MTTLKLQLPTLLGSQDQKHVTHNEALFFLDQLTQLSVLDRHLATPPGSPTAGDAYIVASTSATGDWLGKEDDIAMYDGDGWVFRTPAEGWFAWVQDEAKIFNFTSGFWSSLGDVLGANYTPLTGATITGETIFNISGERARVNQYGFGIGGAVADASNQFAFYGTDMLFNSGSNINMKFNKSGSGDNASLVFQQGFTTYAIMGLLADNSWTLKTGTGFNIAVVADENGDVTFPNQTTVRSIQPFGGRWYMDTDNSWAGPAQYANAENITINGGTGADPTVDWDAKGDHYIRSGSVINSLECSINVSSTEVTDVYWKLYFQYPDTWDGQSNAAGEFTRVEIDGGTITPANTGFIKVDFLSSEYTAPADGHLLLVMKPNGTLTATRYVQVTGLLDVLMDMS